MSFIFLPVASSEKWFDLDVCTEYTLAEIEAATDNWSGENLIGKGAFAQVFKGTSPTGQLWAVKRSLVMTNDFENEVRAWDPPNLSPNLNAAFAGCKIVSAIVCVGCIDLCSTPSPLDMTKTLNNTHHD